jgi:mannose-6-phosphate isomerase-like protein (cupin superfamily)
MNIREYIETGIIGRYCLGALSGAEMLEVERLCDRFPEIMQEITVVQETLESYAATVAMDPPAHIKGRIWDTLADLEKEQTMDINDLPAISRFSDHKKWLSVVRPFIPSDPTEDRIIKVLRESDKIIQMLVISKTDFDDEVHVHEHESFIILEGECECKVGDEVFRLTAGGYTEIPLHTPHDVRIISPYVVAVLQRVGV